MPKKARELSPLEVRRLTRPGRWSVGGTDGLALQVTSSGCAQLGTAHLPPEAGSAKWDSEFSDSHPGRGPRQGAAASGAGEARYRPDRVPSSREQRCVRRATSATDFLPGRRAIHRPAREVLEEREHQSQWAATLRTYAEPLIGKLLVRDIRTTHVIGVLEPIWTTKTETATRVRSRIELVLDYAAARGFRDGLNPARWKGNLDAALPNASKVAPVRHHAAVDVEEVASFMKRLRSQDGVGARALEFAVLTAARSGEVRGATWSEIDLKATLWTIPDARMKSGREHRVPLSRPAITLLRSLPGIDCPRPMCSRGCGGRFPT